MRWRVLGPSSLLVIVLLLCAVPADAMQRRSWLCQSITGAAIPACSITVYTAGTVTKATIYGDQAGSSALGNPITAGSDGTYSYYAANGRYTEVLSASGFTFGAAQTQDFILNDPAGTPASTGALVNLPYATPASAYSSFAAAITAIGSTTATLMVDTVQSVTGNVTVPFNVTLLFSGAGQLSISTGQVVTIGGPILAPRQRIFAGAGTVSLGHGTNYNHAVVYPEWWGAKNDGVTDNNASATGFLQSAINAFTGAGVIDFNEGAYNYSTGLTVTRELEIRGQSQRGTGLFYTGAGGTAIYCNLSADSFYIHDISLDNTNATPGAVGIDLDCERATLARMEIVPTKGFTTAVIRSGNGGAVFRTLLDNLFVSGKSIGQSHAIGYYAVAGNAALVRDSHFAGNNVAIRAGAGGVVDNLNVRGSIIEMFDGTNGPGVAGSIGIDIVNAQGFMVYGNKFEANSVNNVPMQVATADGAMVTGNFFIGDGTTATGVLVNSSAAKGVVFVGNTLTGFTGQGINLIGGGQVDVLTNYLGNSTITMKSDRDITGHQLGSPNYVLQPGQGFDGFAFQLNPIFNKAAGSAHTNLATAFLQKPTIQGGAATVANATILKLGTAPTEGTLRNNALWSLGAVTFDGTFQANAGIGIFTTPPADPGSLTFTGGLFSTAATGGNKGASTVNASSYYVHGTAIASMPLTNASGTLTNAPHMVQDTVTLIGGTAGVALAGAAAFTNATSYTCVCDNDSAVLACRVVQNGGTGFTVSSGAGTDVVRFICVGS